MTKLGSISSLSKYDNYSQYFVIENENKSYLPSVNIHRMALRSQIHTQQMQYSLKHLSSAPGSDLFLDSLSSLQFIKVEAHCISIDAGYCIFSLK